MHASLLQLLRRLSAREKKLPLGLRITIWVTFLATVVVILMLAQQVGGIGRAVALYVAGAGIFSAVTYAVIRFIDADEAMEKKRGLTIAQVIGSGGFNLLRSPVLPDEIIEHSRESPRSAAETDEWRKEPENIVVKGGPLYLQRDYQLRPWPGPVSRSRRVRRALRSSGFSLLREATSYDKRLDRG
jgi:hypothetical protein